LTRWKSPVRKIKNHFVQQEREMAKDDFPQRLERAFVELVTERAEQRGMGKMEFAARMWPWMKPKIASTRWTAMRSKSAHTGKPQNVTIADAQRMADALGEELAYFIVLAKEEVLNELQATKDKGADS
jgi:hypothetical protein